MSDVDAILKEASAGLNELLQPTAAAPPDAYRKTQDARFADYDALISTLRGPTRPPQEAAPVPQTQPATPFPKAPDVDRRSTTGIAAPTLPQNTPPIPAYNPNDFQAPAAEPPLVVKRLEMPR